MNDAHIYYVSSIHAWEGGVQLTKKSPHTQDSKPSRCPAAVVPSLVSWLALTTGAGAAAAPAAAMSDG